MANFDPVRSLVQKKTPEQRAAEAAAKAEREREADARREAQRREKLRQAFFASPAGQARAAFETGNQVFQYSIDVMNQAAIIVAMVGSTTAKKTNDPTIVLNAVCAEGWELVNGSFVFVEEGQQSRDKFMSSGQNVAIKGATVGYYLFKRCEANRRLPLPEPWNDAAPTALDTAIDLFEEGRVKDAASVLRQLRTEALSSQDEGLLTDIDRVVDEMRGHLHPSELPAFDDRLGLNHDGL
jgi:hypothetical protein